MLFVQLFVVRLVLQLDDVVLVALVVRLDLAAEEVLKRVRPEIVLDHLGDVVGGRVAVLEEPQEERDLDFAFALLREDHVAQVLALRRALPGDLGRRAGRVAAGCEMKLLDQHPVLEVRILVEVELDSVAALDVLELLDLDVLQVLNALLLLGAQDAADLRVVHERGHPEVRNLLDQLVSFLEERLAQLVVLLLDFQDLFAGLLVQRVDLVLTVVDLL